MTSPYHIETIPLIYRPNQWTGSYMIGAFIMKDLMSFEIFTTQATLKKMK